MGNASGRAKQKPVIIKGVPGGGGRLFKDTFVEGADRDEVKLAEGPSPSAYYLPWQNGDFTEGEITLGTKQIKSFYTADMSGCSLWYKFESGKLKIRHEARTDKESKWLHSSAGYTCVVDSSANEEDVQLKIDGMTKTAQYYMVYALLDYKEKVIEFRSQIVKLVADMETKAERFELVRLTILPVPLPGS